MSSEHLPTIHDLDNAPDVSVISSLDNLMELSPHGGGRISYSQRSLVSDVSLQSPSSATLETDSYIHGNWINRSPRKLDRALTPLDSEDDGSEARNSKFFVDNDDDDESNSQEVRASFGSSIPRPRCIGIPMPMCCAKIPSSNRISAFLARRAPCFWFCPYSRFAAATDRTVLYRLNILCAFFALGQMAAGAFIAIVPFLSVFMERSQHSPYDNPFKVLAPNFWSLNSNVFMLGLLGCCILITSLATLRVVREVNIRGAIRYLWVLLWILPVQIFLLIGIIDLRGVTNVWIIHWWNLASMAWFRDRYCLTGTANTLCLVPVGGYPNYTSEDDWCESLFMATNCTEIRDNAQAVMLKQANKFYYTVAGWVFLTASLLILSVTMLETIITKPISQAARESNVPKWMLLPIIGCFATGSVFLFSDSSVIRGSSDEAQSQWVGFLYFVAGGCFFVSALLGWFISNFTILDSQDRKNKQVAVICFIGINVFVVALVGAIFIVSLLVTIEIVKVPLSDEERGDAACSIDNAGTCSFCGSRVGKRECPEWTEEQVAVVLETQYKSSATLAAIFIVYAISATRYAFVLKKQISMYQIEYI